MQVTAERVRDRRAADSLRVANLSNPSPRLGFGEQYCHHGEIMQGLFYSSDGKLEHALVTLPCNLFRSRAQFRPARSGAITVQPAGRSRSRTAARLTLDALGYFDWGGRLSIESDVPLCWGCGSSTSDVLATIRAVADAMNTPILPDWIARIAVASETASDSLMYGPDRAVLFAQRRGSVLVDLGGPMPPVRVVGFNVADDHGLETLNLPPIRYSSWEVEAFRPMLGLLRRAVAQQDPTLVGRVATASATITQRHRPKRFMPQLLSLAREVGALGVQVAHSGTVAGLLFAPERSSNNAVARVRASLTGLGLRSWEFLTKQ